MTYSRIVVVAITLLAGILPLSRANAAPTIEFLNPSDYQTTLSLSDKEDADTHYHLVAWVGSMPLEPSVEFEVKASLGSRSASFQASHTGEDIFEAFIPTGQFPDGEYRLKAILFSGDSSVAETNETVTVNSHNVPPPPPSETVEITSPDNGAQLGFYIPKGAPATTVIDGLASTETIQARALYTTSRPGTDPFWRDCGSNNVRDDDFVRVRCTLATGDNPLNVTAVALVANQTPPSAPIQSTADQTGDAHRVLPAISVPAEIDIAPETSTVEPDLCQRFVARVSDQSGRPLAGVGLDVHAEGPDDSLRFGVMTDPTREAATDDFRGPNDGHSSQEAAISCLDESHSQTSLQGEHNRPGQHDPKHIESIIGTNADGEFSFALHSAQTGASEIIVWADDDENDILDPLEATGGSMVGWGQAPPQPSTSVVLAVDNPNPPIGDCVRLDMVTRRGGNPVAQENVDVHLSGPDPSATFCSPSGADPSAAPDSGGHIGDAHEDGVRHLEGLTSNTGRFIFGITAASIGTSSVVAWHDRFDDDILGGDEASDTESVTWHASDEPREISLSSNKRSVRQGRRVTFFGRISGTDPCRSGHAVRLKAKRTSDDRFRTVATTNTDAQGGYSLRVRVRTTKIYKAIAPRRQVCQRAASRRVRVRATQ